MRRGQVPTAMSGMYEGNVMPKKHNIRDRSGLFGEPKDVEGACNAHLYIGDNSGDNHATMRCKRSKGHVGAHEEYWMSDKAVVRWDEDERDWDELPFEDERNWEGGGGL